MRRRYVWMFLAVSGTAVVAVILLFVADLGGGGQSEAQSIVADVPLEDLAELGVFVTAPESGSSPKVDEGSAVSAARAKYSNAEVVDSSLISLETLGDVAPAGRLAWAVVIDPRAASALPLGPMPSDNLVLRETKYQISFWDANTGEFLVAVQYAE